MREKANGPEESGRVGRSVLGIGGALAVAAWFGLVAGLLDLGLTVARVRMVQHGLYRSKSPHVIWMIPVSCVVIFVAVGLVVAVGSRMVHLREPRRCQVFYVVMSGLAVFAAVLAVPGIRAAAWLLLAAGVASWVGPWLASRARGFESLVRVTLPALGLMAIGLAGWPFGRAWMAERAAIAARPPATPSADAPNVLLIVMDTVRADATSLHGAKRDTTPNLVELARRGVKFDRAIAPAPWTLPSHASMFTGLWPWQLEVGLDRPLSAEPTTLAETFGDAGYATAGFVANTVFCSREYGLGRGFAHYEDYVLTPGEVFRGSSLGWLLANRGVSALLDRVLPLLGREPRHLFEAPVRRKSAAEIGAAVLGWIDAKEPERPFFAFLNFMDAHDPYLLPVGVAGRFSNPITPADVQMLKRWSKLEKGEITPREVALARDGYDDGIAYLDEQIARLLKELESRGLLENTIVVVTSDHGEHFGGHQRDGEPIYGHAMSLYQAEIRVPLLIVAPGRVPGEVVIERPVSLRDLPATLVELAGVAGREGSAKEKTLLSMPGQSLAATWGRRESEAAESWAEEAVLSESALLSTQPPERRYQEDAPGLMRAVVAGDLSYHRIDGDREELYDLADDPLERRDLAGDPEAESMLREMREVLESLAPRPMGGAGVPES